MRPDVVRAAGRDPILSVAISCSGVIWRKKVLNPGVSYTSARYCAKALSDIAAIADWNRPWVSPAVAPPSSDASSVAAAMASRFAAALSGVPYLAAITSPCSVMRRRPCTVPAGCAQMAANAGPPPRPTEPPRPWKICMATPTSSNTAASARVAWLRLHTEVR